MNVVGHQNIGINIKAKPPAVVFDSLEVTDSVFGVSKDLLAAVASCNDVIECSFKFGAGLSGHEAVYYKIKLKVQTQA
jgi:hypothetical protein